MVRLSASAAEGVAITVLWSAVSPSRSGDGVWAPVATASLIGQRIAARSPAYEPLRVLVVADDALARAGLAAVLADQPDCRVVGQAPSDADLTGMVERLDAHVVVWDTGRHSVPPGLRGLDVLGAPVLLLASVGVVGSALPPAGAHGLVSRDLDAATIAAALRAIERGLTVIDPAPAFGSDVLPQQPDRAPLVLLEPLTRREVEVLQWLAAGLSNRLIAERLLISEHTVRFHLNSIFSKLAAHTRTEAVSRAARLGLIVL